MNRTNTHLLLLAGAWLSLVALVIGGSVMLPVQKEAGERSTALLYKFSSDEMTSSASKVAESGKTIVADLRMMKVLLYEDGMLVRTSPVLSKGRPGTPWETPSGVYAIQTKEIKHLSSIGGTWMPYSMQFYGNFYIHGWPTYMDGKDVPPGYSGGCIRLSTEDARLVYEFAPEGARLVVLAAGRGDEFATSSRYYLHGDGHVPFVTAPSFVIADVDSGVVLWERHSRDLRDPKGLTSLMTSLTAVETVNQYKLVRMSELLMGRAVLRRHSIGAADELPAGALLYPLLFEGSDTAARVFTKEHGEKQFVSYMNDKSTAIGMADSLFDGVLSTGGSTTTARDLMTLLRYVNDHKHFLIDVTQLTEQTLFDDEGDERYDWTNKNPWVISGDGAFRGGIVSADTSGRDGAMLLFDLPLAEFTPRTIAFVIMDSEDIEGDIRSIRRFVAGHFVFGIEREVGSFVREKEEPTPSLLERARALINLGSLLQDKVEYEREV